MAQLGHTVCGDGDPPANMAFDTPGISPDKEQHRTMSKPTQNEHIKTDFQCGVEDQCTQSGGLDDVPPVSGANESWYSDCGLNRSIPFDHTGASLSNSSHRDTGMSPNKHNTYIGGISPTTGHEINDELQKEYRQTKGFHLKQPLDYYQHGFGDQGRSHVLYESTPNRLYDRAKDTPWSSREQKLESEKAIESTTKTKIQKEKKSLSTKTFAHGMMDVSLLTSNATQLRSILSNPQHEFYNLLLWLIGISVIFQIVSGILLIMSDFYKTQVKEKDRANQQKRKVFNFISLALVTLITSLNVLIAAFYSPSAVAQVASAPRGPQFSSMAYQPSLNHTEL